MPVDLDDRAQCAFGGQGQAVVGGLAVDEEAAALGLRLATLAPAESRSSPLHKQQPNPESRRPQRLGGGHLRGDDALGVADAAAIQKLVVLAEWDVGRNGVHVRGKHQIGRLARRARIDVPASSGVGALRGCGTGVFSTSHPRCGEKIRQKIAHRALMVGSGLDLAQLAGQLNGVNGFSGRIKRQTIGHDAARIPHAAFTP